MRLIRHGEIGKEKPGILLNGKRKDCSEFFDDWDHEFFNNGGLKRLEEFIAEQGDDLPGIPDGTRWGPCVARPGMIMCIGLNYSDHARESGMDVPEEPVIFMKATNTLSGPYDSVEIPRNSEKTDWEVELGVVLNKDALYLNSEEEAAGYVAGYCIVHDISERTFQLEKSGQWVKGKSCPGFSPAGPYLATPDEIDNVLDLEMSLSVNGQVMQDGNTKTMVFKPHYLIWYLSQFMKLEAGDIISTGTPPGVGLGQKPPVYLKRSDEVKLTITGLGSQEQKFI